MADGSREDRADPKHTKLTFAALEPGHGDTNKCSDETINVNRVKLSFYTELQASESDKSNTRGVVAERSAAADSRKSSNVNGDCDDRKKRCFDRYDSSESSDSGVAVLSPTESGGCSSSDITEPRSPRSPESSCSREAEEGASARMPPWASDPAPPGPRRLAVQPAPTRRHQPPAHRRITQYFNHKMKSQNGLKRDANNINNDDTKRKCLPKTSITNDLEKYISYLSKTLSPKVLLEVEKQTDNSTVRKQPLPQVNGLVNVKKSFDLNKSSVTNVNGIVDNRPKDIKDKLHSSMNGFVEVRHVNEALHKDKFTNGIPKCPQKQVLDINEPLDPSANRLLTINKLTPSFQHKVPIPASNEGVAFRVTSTMGASPKKMVAVKPDTRINGVVSSTTKLDSRMNGVTYGSNNLSLNPITPKTVLPKKETTKKTSPNHKRTYRKQSACIPYSKNLSWWSKTNNLKQVQPPKHDCVLSAQKTPIKPKSEINTAPKINIPNGVRQVPLTANGSLGHLNVPVTNLTNCHQINIPQSCNGTVPSNLASFVTVPQNMMITTLRIPQHGIQAQPINQQNNMAAFNTPNVNVSSPTKLNGQIVFPLVQNINGTVVQIPNLMAKMPSFVLPQTSQLTAQRQDHLPNQQTTQFLFNGTLLKLGNTMTSTYSNLNNKHNSMTSQSLPTMDKNVTGLPTVGMTVQPKSTNYTVNLSHPVLMPQPGFIVTSVPNMNVKETWSYPSTNTASSSQTTCSNPIVHHPPIMTNFGTQTLHSSSIPIAPVKPPDNPIQGTEPPSSTVKEPESIDVAASKCDMPWLSKTVNNNIVPYDTSKMTSRPFAQMCSLLKKFEESTADKKNEEITAEKRTIDSKEELKKVEEVSRREETIFTQITVLKDVSSNVENTVIEANFSSATMESSESGIGTDKSIDSPSDSQTSKECDEDSSLSLSVSLCSVEVQSSQKSPILKQPITLRFPPRLPPKAGSGKRTSSTDTSVVTVCLWENCKKEMTFDTDLLEHIQTEHVETQQGKKNYVCLWEQCKVRGKPSCSRLWLERHASSHGGNKPYKCIVDGCGRRFSTQILLERHVNNHFDETSPNTSSGKKTADAPKLIRRNGKKLRYRRQPWSARMFDYFDAGMMEGLAWRLGRSSRWRLGGACPLREPPGRHTLTLHASLAATRYNAAEARTEALLTYYPPHVVEDEWVPEKDVKRVKRVEICELPAHTKVQLYEQFCASYKPTTPPSAPAPPASPVLPRATCTSSRLLNNLLAKKGDLKEECSATNIPLIYKEEENKTEVSGAKKRKIGRKYGGGNAFWPCGR